MVAGAEYPTAAVSTRFGLPDAHAVKELTAAKILSMAVPGYLGTSRRIRILPGSAQQHPLDPGPVEMWTCVIDRNDLPTWVRAAPGNPSENLAMKCHTSV